MKGFSRYLDLLARTNRLENSVQWLFFPGMLAESRAKWWGDFKFRHADHEGVDICFFRRKPVCMDRLGPATRVPAFSDSVVRHICQDFLGHSIVTEPDPFKGGRTRVLLVYSHLSPWDGIMAGSRVEKGQILATLFDTASKDSLLLPHLHLSLIEVPLGTPDQALDWTLFPDRGKVNLINPVFL